VVLGHREFTLLAIATGSNPPAPPCGLCRQVLSEFSPRLPILLVNEQGGLLRTRLEHLLPMGFDFFAARKR
jgi:cytidine deaminase